MTERDKAEVPQDPVVRITRKPIGRGAQSRPGWTVTWSDGHYEIIHTFADALQAATEAMEDASGETMPVEPDVVLLKGRYGALLAAATEVAIRRRTLTRALQGDGFGLETAVRALEELLADQGVWLPEKRKGRRAAAAAAVGGET